MSIFIAQLRKQFPTLSKTIPALPEKDYFRFLEADVVQRRRAALEEYFAKIISSLPSVSSLLLTLVLFCWIWFDCVEDHLVLLYIWNLFMSSFWLETRCKHNTIIFASLNHLHDSSSNDFMRVMNPSYESLRFVSAPPIVDITPCFRTYCSKHYPACAIPHKFRHKHAHTNTLMHTYIHAAAAYFVFRWRTKILRSEQVNEFLNITERVASIRAKLTAEGRVAALQGGERLSCICRRCKKRVRD